MAKKKHAGIESSLDRLQEIVHILDSDETLLEEGMKLYEEGIEIVEKCVKELSEARGKIKELRKRSDGVLELLDFDEEQTLSH